MALSMPSPGEGGEGEYRPLAEINVTPMVDVMLVLLIIFMVTAPLLAVGVPLELPKTSATEITQPKRPIVAGQRLLGFLPGRADAGRVELLDPLPELVGLLAAEVFE